MSLKSIATVLQRPHDPKAAMADPSAEVALIYICLGESVLAL